MSSWWDSGGQRALPQQRLKHKAVLMAVHRHTELLFLGYWQRILKINNPHTAYFHVRVKNSMDGALTNQIRASSACRA